MHTSSTSGCAFVYFTVQFVHNFREFEKVDEASKEVFSNLVTLSEKLELDL